MGLFRFRRAGTVLGTLSAGPIASESAAAPEDEADWGWSGRSLGRGETDGDSSRGGAGITRD